MCKIKKKTKKYKFFRHEINSSFKRQLSPMHIIGSTNVTCEPLKCKGVACNCNPTLINKVQLACTLIFGHKVTINENDIFKKWEKDKTLDKY